MDRLKKAHNGNGSERQSFLRSSPNILENFAYDDFKRLQETSLPATSITSLNSMPSTRPKSPFFSDTLTRHEFMRNVISPRPVSVGARQHDAVRYSSPSEKEASARRSLEEISRDIKEIEEFITATEDVLRREREMDRVNNGSSGLRRRRISKESPDKENKTPVKNSGMPQRRVLAKKLSPPVTYKIGLTNYKNRRSKPNSPKFLNSRLYFRNGKIGCLDAERLASNIESTHALVKQIIQYEHEKPLVSPESVRRVLGNRRDSGVPSSTETVPLPGAVIDCERGGVESSLRATSLNAVDKDEETYDSNSQPIVDEDEQDVQICYDELPEIPNEEQNLGPPLIANVLESEIVAVDQMPLEPARSSNRTSTADSLDSEGQQFVRNQVRHLVRRFTARANKMKSRIELPPTPSSTGSTPSPPPPAAVGSKNALNANKLGGTKISTIQSSPNRARLFEADTPRSNVWLCSSLCGSNNDEKTLDPQGKIYISWLCVVSFSFLYNAWVIPLRSTFPFQTEANTNSWLIADFCADIIYLLDVVFFKHRVMYLFEGFWVKNKNLTRKNYCRKLQFKLDLLALLPLELLYFKFGTSAVWLRFPRFFKVQSFWEVFKLLDRVISAPHFVRVAKTLTYMLYMIHLTACAYYAYSDYQGLGVNRWVFSGVGHPYVRCFSFATKTATSIGKNPKPEREGEFVFMTAAWLMGVFVFALLIGQIRDIISTATRNKNEYRQLEDETLEYMRRLNLPKEVQRRVKMWFKFTWDQQRTLDESNILDSLPINLKTDIAISVHIQTLSKVQLFADCEEALLRDLVLKLRAVTFLPGDYVCRKGEVGREMYIIKLGQVQVMGGPNNDVVLATLSEGSVFGEISLLGINGADRRTADVRSKGYANLFVLSKSDLNEVIAYYPNAQAILKKRARTLMRKNAAREREEARVRSALKADVVIGNPKTPETPPKLLKTVIQALPYESPAVMLITTGSKRLRKKRSSQMETMPEHCEAEQNLRFNPRDSFVLMNEKRSYSPDLLSSIQDELKTKHKFINLTDSEKALIVSTSSNTSIEPSKEDEQHSEV